MFDGATAYAVCMALAMATMMTLRLYFPPPAGLRRRERVAIGLGAFCGAMLAAKLPFVILGGGWLDPGKTILAGLAGGYLGVEAAKWILGLRVKLGDGYAVPLAAAVAVGRMGCFFNGCCGGVETTAPWAIAGRHPAALYEVGFHIAMALVLWRLYERRAFPRQLLKLYLISYGLFRFGVEFIRTESRLVAGLTGYQIGALAMAGVMALLWWVDARERFARATEFKEATERMVVGP